jgi:steroid delta-isomerase-like uncharacterized protein
MSEKNKAIVRKVYEEGWNKNKLDIFDEIMGAGYVNHDPSRTGMEELDVAGYKQYAGGILAAFPDCAFTILDQIADGDKTATRWQVSGTHVGEYMGIPATGKNALMTGMSIHRFVGGKIAEEWSNWDALGLLQQLGVVPAPQ